jgi:predicted RNase H-like HicB family nuclease
MFNKIFRRGDSQGTVLKVLFSEGEDGFIIAECPQLPGCMSQGKTREEAIHNLMDAIESVLMVRMGQLIGEIPANVDDRAGSAGEGSLRLKAPELVCV